MTVGPGQLVAGRYRLCDLIGRGSMGTVWLAADDVLCRQVAVKEVIYPPYLTDEERQLLRERTLREARAAAGLAHPQVTTVHDVVEQDGKPWIVMEHVRSRTLIQAVREDGPLSPERVAAVGLDLLGALSAAHLAGIIHRDVKPANVLLGEGGQAWLTDFGIATCSGDSSLTTEGILVGSPSYMSPERARGEEPGPAADLWSLGATLYTAAEGRPPFERGEPVATLVAVLMDEPAAFCAAGPLEPVLRRLLAKDPAQRPSVEQARRALEVVAVPARTGRPTVGAPSPGQAARPATPDLASADRADRIERLPLAELSAIATETAKAEASAMATTVAATTAAAARAAARAAGRAGARGAARAATRASSRRHRQPSPAQSPPAQSPPAQSPPVQSPPVEPATAQPGASRVSTRTTTAPPSRAARSAHPDRAAGHRWRFKKRWVAVPLAVVLLLLTLALVVAGLLVWAVVTASG